MQKTERRDRLKIISDLLENMKEPKRTTHLLYASHLSYTQLVKYLGIIKSMGLAKEQKKPFYYLSITNEGRFFIEMVKKRN